LSNPGKRVLEQFIVIVLWHQHIVPVGLFLLECRGQRDDDYIVSFGAMVGFEDDTWSVAINLATGIHTVADYKDLSFYKSL